MMQNNIKVVAHLLIYGLLFYAIETDFNIVTF